MAVSISIQDTISFGCIFCMTGKERTVAQTIEKQHHGIQACAASQIKRFTKNGITTLQDQIMIPSYVFVKVPAGADIHDLAKPDGFINVLTYSDGDWRLNGEDEEYVSWIFKYDGELPLSRAHQIGDRIVIIDGPLKDFEGQITKVDKRNRCGQVLLNFAGRQQKVWLGFDIVKESPEHEASNIS
jgi:transcription antitermination factor NusG